MTTIVLAAGLSSRMGQNKLLLPFKGSTILETTLKAIMPYSDRIIVITGHDKEKIEKLLRPYPIMFVYNRCYKDGQRSSSLLGVENVSDDDFMIIPGDLPYIKSSDIEGVQNMLSKSSISRAMHNEEPGHPVAYRKENREKLLAFPGTMKEYLEASGYAKFVASIGSILDVDTPSRYESLISSNNNPIILE